MSILSRLFGKRPEKEQVQEPMVIMYVVSLIATLGIVEQKKGAALTEEEVLKVRDEAPCIAVTVEQAIKMTQSRGYKDIDPENVWEEWQKVRENLSKEDERPTDG